MSKYTLTPSGIITKALLTLLLGLGWQETASLQTYTLAPYGVHQYDGDDGLPCANCKLYTYAAGTTDLLTTYSTNTGTANANPIVLDSTGRATIYLSASNYKFVLKTSADATLWTRDNIGAVPTTNVSLDVNGIAGEALSAGDVAYLSDASGSCGATAGRWYKADADNTCSSTAAKFIGMVQLACTSGQTDCAVRVQGRITGLSSLTAGTEYYASATAGALTSTAPANARRIGVADSTTAVLIAPNPGNTIPSLTVTGNTTLGDAAADTVTVAGALANTSLRVLDTNASHALVVAPGSDLTAERTLTVTTGDAARTVTLNGNPTLNDWFDQSVKAAASPTFVGVTLSGAIATPTSITMTGALATPTTITASSTITSGGDYVFSSTGLVRRNTSDGSDSGTVEINGGGGSGPSRGASITLYGNDGSGADGAVYIKPGNVASSSLRVVDDGNNVLFKVDEDDGMITAQAVYTLTDAGAANVVVTSGGELRRSTSSARYKTNLRAATSDSWRWLLELTPHIYNDINGGTREYGGLLAEEVVEHGPKGADGYPLFATLDAEGRPDWVQYPHLTAPLIAGLQDHEAVIQKQRDLIQGLQTRIRALEAAVKDLQAKLP